MACVGTMTQHWPWNALNTTFSKPIARGFPGHVTSMPLHSKSHLSTL